MAERAQIQSLSDEYQALQTQLSTLVAALQKLESQHQENQGVHKEFQNLGNEDEEEKGGGGDGSRIYKLVGPVLLKQDISEAKSTVQGRLEYIEKEIKRVDGSIKEIQEKSEGKKMEILRIQLQMQQG